MNYLEVIKDGSVVYYGNVKKGDLLYVPSTVPFVYRSDLIELKDSNDDFDFKTLLDQVWVKGCVDNVLEEEAKWLIFDLLYLYVMVTKYAYGIISFEECRAFLGSKDIKDIRSKCESYIGRKASSIREVYKSDDYSVSLDENNSPIVRYSNNVNSNLIIEYSNSANDSLFIDPSKNPIVEYASICSLCGKVFNFEVSSIQIDEITLCGSCFELVIEDIKSSGRFKKKEEKYERTLDF